MYIVYGYFDSNLLGRGFEPQPSILGLVTLLIRPREGGRRTAPILLPFPTWLHKMDLRQRAHQ